jgi:hypothetical protein
VSKCPETLNNPLNLVTEKYSSGWSAKIFMTKGVVNPNLTGARMEIID